MPPQTDIEPRHMRKNQALVTAFRVRFQEFDQFLGRIFLGSSAAAELPKRRSACLAHLGRSFQKDLNALVYQNATVKQFLGERLLRLQRLLDGEAKLP